MVVDLLAGRAGIKQAAVRASLPDGPGLPGVPTMLAGSHARVAPDREWRSTMARALEQLPSGSCLVIRDASGREWHIGPASRAVARSLREAA